MSEERQAKAAELIARGRTIMDMLRVFDVEPHDVIGILACAIGLTLGNSAGIVSDEAWEALRRDIDKIRVAERQKYLDA